VAKRAGAALDLGLVRDLTLPHLDAAYNLARWIIGSDDDIDYVSGQRTPVIVYRRRQHVIDVYWMPDAQPPAPEILRQGYWLSPCRIDGRSVQLVADVDRQELELSCNLLSRAH